MVKFGNGSHSSNQLLYIGDNISGLYLSEKAQIDLKMIPPSYPFCDPSQETSQVSHVEDPLPPTGSPYNTLTAPCGCPLWQDSPPMPQELPYPPTNENHAKLEQWLLSHFASSAFDTCEHQTLPEMTGQPLTAHFRPDAQGKVFHTPIPVPHHWKSAVKSELDCDVQLGTIEPVPQGVPTKWCARMVVVPKKDWTSRRTVDLQHLNIATYRETHHVASPFDQASVIPPHTKKTILDAWNGYHSLPLDNLSKDATTFITEWGRYHYRCAPQGFMQLVMPTIAGLMTSQWTSLARPRLWMIPCFGITALRTPFGTHWNTLTCAPRKALYSTQRSSNSPWMKLTSQDSTSPQPAYAHLNVSWMPSSTFPFQPTLLTSDSGSASLTRQHTLSPWLTRCYHSGTSSRKVLSGTVTKIWRACS